MLALYTLSDPTMACLNSCLNQNRGMWGRMIFSHLINIVLLNTKWTSIPKQCSKNHSTACSNNCLNQDRAMQGDDDTQLLERHSSVEHESKCPLSKSYERNEHRLSKRCSKQSKLTLFAVDTENSSSGLTRQEGFHSACSTRETKNGCHCQSLRSRVA
jgi:hypothetical protein